ncbi:MAG: carbamoyl-phosphate synthase (glutamine-hydrolyzing) large subunit [Nanoarchaeota archaeon]
MKLNKVLILGSGGLKIGQAGEFDYSGSQAIKALKEENIQIVLVNPNIATIQTSENMADKTYFLPVTLEFVEKVIEKERPEGLLLAFGGQTALNCGVELERKGVLKRYNVQVLGTSIKSIENTEDRDLFAKCLSEIKVKIPKSLAVVNLEGALAAAKKIGYPLMIRVAYALGGQGSGLCRDEKELVKKCEEAFSETPQILVEEWLGGWKEIEYEVVRDAYDNCITVCNMENFDPLGIHTGESIVVAPSQTLTNREYHKLREIAIAVIRHLKIIGECNIQFALDPYSEDYRIIEVNARLSRSSALASKATGYPLAFIAAKLALGYSLTDIENKITKKTQACFEPALDYVVVKMPRWDLKKFKVIDHFIGTEMKSVGEVMAIGRKFEEALQKAIRMIDTGLPGLATDCFRKDCLGDELKYPTDKRILALIQALKEGWSPDQIYESTKIDRWFLYKLKNITDCEKELKEKELTAGLLLKAKQLGFSDFQISQIKKSSELEIRNLRKKLSVLPCIKQIDTLAAEYPAKTNYLYLTYNGEGHDVSPSERGVIVLGSGPYRIGSSVEFDWCCVNMVSIAKKLGYLSIVINCNPETVSTDYDVCDRLYFEELSFERVLDIYEFEDPEGIVVSMGGQIPNNLALKLHKMKVRILGTPPGSIDVAEDRHKFSRLLDQLDIDQPPWKELCSPEEARNFANKVGYPVLIRPSYVLSGAAMNTAWDDQSLIKYLNTASEVNPEHPVVISKFIENSKEIEIDAVANRGEIIIYALSEHIENAGVHSGDATLMLPAQKLYLETARRIKKIARQIAEALQITGPFNIQFLAYKNKVKVIECNLRASRSFPFCSKVFKQNLIEYAAYAILGKEVKKVDKSSLDLDYVGVKAAQFSFSRLKGADPVLGVEMSSTGEVACFSSELNDAFLKAFLSIGFKIPKKNILLSTGPVEKKAEFLESAKKLKRLGYTLFASEGTANFLKNNNVEGELLHWPLEDKKPNIRDYLKDGKIDLVINIPKNNLKEELRNDYLIRRIAVDFNIPLITDIKIARQMAEALEYCREHGFEIKSWEEY